MSPFQRPDVNVKAPRSERSSSHDDGKDDLQKRPKGREEQDGETYPKENLSDVSVLVRLLKVSDLLPLLRSTRIDETNDKQRESDDHPHAVLDDI